MIHAEDQSLLLPEDLYGLASTSVPAAETAARSRVRSLSRDSERISVRILFGVCALSIFVQGLLLAFDRQATFASNVFIVLEFLSVAAACLLRAFRENVETRSLWILIASGFFLSIAGQILSTYESMLPNPPTTATLADVFFLIYGIPVLLAISFTTEDSDLRVLFWLDGAQAIVAAVLIYFQIFHIVSSPGHSTAISLTSLMYVYNAENLTLAGAITLRLFGNPAPATRCFYISLSIYLWSYAVVAAIVGYFELDRNSAPGPQDALWGLPCLLLLGVLSFQPAGLPAPNRADKKSTRSIALLLDNLSPVLFTLVIVVLGASIASAFPRIGFGAIAAAVALYGIRTAFLQRKYLRSQQELAKSGLALVDAIERLREISIRDGLTGIYNRRHFDEVLVAEWKRSIRTQKPLSLLLIDVDCFKELNDRYGHPEGDECLKKIAWQFTKILRRSSDTLARYGGEEFVAILPETAKESAERIADAIRKSVEDLKIKNEDSKVTPVVTVSVGVCSEQAKLSRSAEALLNAADAALYRAKKLGRNRVQFA